jgi:large conductance mechanosensitive channel
VDFSHLFVLLKPGTTPPPYVTLDAAKKAGAIAVGYGLMINVIVNFLIVAFVMFLAVRAVARLRHGDAEPEKSRLCEFCRSKVDDSATRCPHCTSQLAAAKTAAG